MWRLQECGGVELSKTITQEEEEEEEKAHLSVCSFIKPPASLHDLPVQHEIFISCIFCGEALKRLCCRSSFITAAKQSSSDPLRSQIKHRLYSAFVSCWFLTKQDVTDSRTGVLSPLTPLSGFTGGTMPYFHISALFKKNSRIVFPINLGNGVYYIYLSVCISLLIHSQKHEQKCNRQQSEPGIKPQTLQLLDDLLCLLNRSIKWHLLLSLFLFRSNSQRSDLWNDLQLHDVTLCALCENLRSGERFLRFCLNDPWSSRTEPRKQLRGETFTSLVWNLSSSPSLFPSLLWQEAEASERFSRLPEDVTIPASISSRVDRVWSGNFPRTARLPVRRGSDDYLLPVGFLCTPHQVKLLLKPPSLSPAAPRGGGRGLGDAATSNLWMF